VLAYTWSETTPRWREITVVAKVYPASVYSRQQIEIYDAASGNSLSLLYSSATDLQRAHRAAPRRHDLGELRNKVKRSSAAVARFPAQRARPPSPREKVRAVHVYVVRVTKTARPRMFAFLLRQMKINLRIIRTKEIKERSYESSVFLLYESGQIFNRENILLTRLFFIFFRRKIANFSRNVYTADEQCIM